MLTPEQICLRLQESLPLLTDRFHDLLPVQASVVSSGILTLIFATAHGLVTEDQIFINSAKIRNRISNAEVTVDGTVSFTTENEHDLTAYMEERPGRVWPGGKSVELELPTGNVTYNLDPTAAGVPTRYNFEAVEGTPVPAITGEEYLLETRALGVLGSKVITSVPTPTTLTINLVDVPDVPDGPIIMDSILTSIRVSIVADAKRAKKIYTQQAEEKAYMFVIMTDRDVSKSRRNTDDFTSLPESSLKLLNIMQQFSTLVILPTEDDLGAGEVQSWVYSRLFVIMNQCLYGWEKTGYNGDGPGEYNTATYEHVYDWQARAQIDFSDGFINNQTVALRELNTEQTIFDEGKSDANIEY
jgi:hypothetical protein